MRTETALQWKVALAFVAIYIIWGTTYMAIAYGLRGFPPFILSAFRFFSAGVLLFIFCKSKGDVIPPLHVVVPLSISGTVALVGGSGLVTWAEQYVGTGYAATIIACEPFMYILFERKLWRFYFSQKLIIAGLLLGFAGLLMFSSATIPDSSSNGMQLTGNLVLLLSAVLWVGGSLYGKRINMEGYSNTMITSIQLIAAGIFSAFLALLTGEWNRFSPANISSEAWGGLIYLITMGSMVAFLAFTWLMTIRPPALVGTHTYVNPVVAVITGWALAGETFTGIQIVGLVVILMGVLLTKATEYKELKIFSRFRMAGSGNEQSLK